MSLKIIFGSSLLILYVSTWVVWYSPNSWQCLSNWMDHTKHKMCKCLLRSSPVNVSSPLPNSFPGNNERKKNIFKCMQNKNGERMWKTERKNDRESNIVFSSSISVFLLFLHLPYFTFCLSHTFAEYYQVAFQVGSEKTALLKEKERERKTGGRERKKENIFRKETKVDSSKYCT